MSDSENQKSDSSQPEFSHWILWERSVAGEMLSRRQIEVLRDALKNDAEFRRDALAERTVDQMLRIHTETPDQAERFFSQVLAKCKAATDVSVSGTATMQAPTSQILDPVLLENINKDRQNIRREQSGLFFEKNTWLAVAAVALVSITGFGFWYQNQSIKDPANPSLDLSRATQNIDAHEQSVKPEVAGGVSVEDIADNTKSIRNENNDTPSELKSESTEKNQTTDGAKGRLTLAIVTKAEGLEDGSALLNGLTLSAQRIAISQGELEISMLSGTKVNVFSPCILEFLSENSLRLITGELSIAVPNQKTQFLLETPAIAVANTDSAFDIVVEETGRTEVEVRRGDVAIKAIDYPNAQAWNLDADATNSLIVYVPESTSLDDQPRDGESSATKKSYGPIASFARSLSGEKTGVITFNGQSRSFDDELVFSKVREQVFQGVRSPGDSFARNWSRFVETATNEPQPTGTIQLNGKEYSFENYNEAVLAQSNVLAQFAPSDKTNDSSIQADDKPIPPVVNQGTKGSFQGALFIRGQRRDFNSFEEYQEALRELMGPAAEFGFFPFGK